MLGRIRATETSSATNSGGGETRQSLRGRKAKQEMRFGASVPERARQVPSAQKLPGSQGASGSLHSSPKPGRSSQICAGSTHSNAALSQSSLDAHFGLGTHLKSTQISSDRQPSPNSSHWSGTDGNKGSQPTPTMALVATARNANSKTRGIRRAWETAPPPRSGRGSPGHLRPPAR